MALRFEDIHIGLCNLIDEEKSNNINVNAISSFYSGDSSPVDELHKNMSNLDTALNSAVKASNLASAHLIDGFFSKKPNIVINSFDGYETHVFSIELEDKNENLLFHKLMNEINASLFDRKHSLISILHDQLLELIHSSDKEIYKTSFYVAGSDYDFFMEERMGLNIFPLNFKSIRSARIAYTFFSGNEPPECPTCDEAEKSTRLSFTKNQLLTIRSKYVISANEIDLASFKDDVIFLLNDICSQRGNEDGRCLAGRDNILESKQDTPVAEDSK